MAAKVQKKPLYKIISGIRFPVGGSTQCFEEALSYKPQPDDNFIVTYPRCGTTWMQNIVILIFRKGQPLEDYSKFNILSPFIDMVGLEGIRKMSRPGALKTHLPYNLMPYSKDAKYIFVARNPRDACVSLFYHTRAVPDAQYHDGQFDDFFEVFMTGEVEYNDYFDHLLSWYPHRNDKNVYYTTFEQMKADPKTVIYQAAKFLGKEYVDAVEKDNAVMNNILKFTSFQHMKENVNVHSADRRNRLLAKELPKREHIRKGIIGDWKNHFSQDQLNRLDKKFAERTNGTDLDTWWSY